MCFLGFTSSCYPLDSPAKSLLDTSCYTAQLLSDSVSLATSCLLCAITGTLSYALSLLPVCSPPHLFSIESYSVRYISSGVFSEQFSKELMLLNHAQMNISGFTKVYINY